MTGASTDNYPARMTNSNITELVQNSHCELHIFRRGDLHFEFSAEKTVIQTQQKTLTFFNSDLMLFCRFQQLAAYSKLVCGVWDLHSTSFGLGLPPVGNSFRHPEGERKSLHHVVLQAKDQQLFYQRFCNLTLEATVRNHNPYNNFHTHIASHL